MTTGAAEEANTKATAEAATEKKVSGSIASNFLAMSRLGHAWHAYRIGVERLLVSLTPASASGWVRRGGRCCRRKEA